MGGMDRHDACRSHRVGEATKIIDRRVTGGVKDGERDLAALEELSEVEHASRQLAGSVGGVSL